MKKIEKAGKRRLLSFASWLGKYQSSGGEIPENARVLMVKHSERLGNLVILGLALKALKQLKPELSLCVLAPENYKYVLEINPAIDKVIGLNKKEFFHFPWKFLGLLGRIKNEQFDLAIDCSDNISRSTSARFYTIMARTKLTAGFDNMQKPIYAIPILPEMPYEHAVEMYYRLFEKIFDIKLQLTDELVENRAISITQPVLINVGGRGKKIWPIEKFIETAIIIQKKEVSFRFLLGPDESQLEQILMKKFTKKSIIKTNTTKQLVEAIMGASGFISSDTGPMHVAWSLGMPTAAIFIDSQLEKFRPLGKRAIALDSRRKPVSPEDVVEAFLKVRGNI